MLYEFKSPDKLIDSLQLVIKSNNVFAGILTNYILQGSIEDGIISVDDEIFPDYFERKQIIDFFKALDDKGIGSYKVGRRNQPTRLELFASDELIERAFITYNENESPKKKDQEIVDKEKMKEHQFYLRSNLKLQINLPCDFNSEDVNKMKAWLDFLIL